MSNEQDELRGLFGRALRGKTVSEEQAAILGWAEIQLIPALLAWRDQHTKEAECLRNRQLKPVKPASDTVQQSNQGDNEGSA